MAFLEQGQPPYVFHIRSPLYTRALGLPLIAFVLGPLAYIYWNLGANGTEALLKRAVDNFVFWFYILAMLGALAFAVWVIRPPQSTLARFEFSRDRVRFIPNLIARSIGEPSQDAVISPQSTEVLLCYRVWPGQQRGYRIIVRAADGTEFELASHSPHTQVDLNASEVDGIADAVSPATGLPVRVVIRSKLPNGAVEEVSGMPSASKIGTLMGIGAAVAALPWASGIFVGWLSPSPAIVIAVGLVLWFCIVLTLYLAGRTGSPRKKFPAVRTVTTLVTFSAAYGVGFVVTAYLRGRL
jgi:hypothetical protein